MAPVPAYLPYLTLAENCVVLVFQVTALAMFGRLIYCVLFDKNKLLVRSFSGAFSVYVGTHVFGALTGIPYIVHVISGWSVEPVNYRYNPHLMFYAGTTLQGYLTCTAVPVCFLSLDRCLTLTCSHVTYRRTAKWLVYVSVIVYVANFLLFEVFILAELPLDMETGKLCGTYTCFQRKYKTIPALIQKLTCLSISLTLSVYFLWLLRYKAKMVNIKNRVVKATVVVEFILCTIPQCINLAVNLITGHQITEYLGTYLTTLGCCETVICSLIYSRVFLRRRHESASVKPAFNSSSGQHTVSMAERSAAVSGIRFSSNVFGRHAAKKAPQQLYNVRLKST